jgi:hypothetical protein
MAHQQNSASMPPAHGGSYQPGQSRATAAQEQHYAQSNSPPAHGGDYQPGQPRRQNVSQEKASEPTQEQMTAAPHAAYPETGRQQQQQQQPQQQNFIPGPVQPPLGYNPANQVSIPSIYMSLANTV